MNFLNLDQIWWLVTTQNPLKKKNQLTSITDRLKSTKNFNKNYRIRTEALELQLGTKFTYDTIKKLNVIMPRVQFFWIMGADNLLNMHKWYNWKKIFYLCPIIVVDRPKYLRKALSSKSAKYFWNSKVDISRVKKIKFLPAWSYFHLKPKHISSTILRKNVG